MPSSPLLQRANDALNINVPTADIHITTHGSDWLWAVTAVMMLSSVIFIVWAFFTPARNRIFHYMVIAMMLISSVSYYTMASDLGNAAVPVEFSRTNDLVSGATRNIFYSRPIDWFLTNTLIILALLFTAAAPWALLLYTWFLTELMVVALLAGTVVVSTYKWGYFAVAMLGLILLTPNLLFYGRRYANSISPVVSRTYTLSAVWIVFLWYLYPICWGLSEGGNVISPDSEMVFYGVLDILSKPVWSFFLLLSHRSIDPDSIGHAIRSYDEEIAIREKRGIAQGGLTEGPATGPAPQTV